MLNAGWVRGLAPGARRVMVFGATEAARQIARGAGRAGYRVTNHDISYLRSAAEPGVDGLVLDAGNEEATLAEARRAAARLGGGSIGVVVESWAGFTAALALDAELGTRGVRVRPLSSSEHTARAVLTQHPWWRLRQADRPATAMLFGTGPLAEHLVIALFRSMHLPKQKPNVVVVGSEAPGWVASLHQALPQLAQIGSLVGARRAPGLESGCVLYATQPHPDLSSFPAAVPLVWLAGGDAPPHAHPVPTSDWSAVAQGLFGDRQDIRAQAIHDFYFEAALRDGNAPGSRPSMLPWRDLPERFRQASRYQADHVSAKLAMIGARTTDGVERWRFRFGTGELDALARTEHERWSAVQRLDGWHYGTQRDDTAKLTPFLAPYDSLPPEIQDRDRMPVRQIPAQLARISQAVKRDLLVTLSADAGAEPGFAFAFQFRSLLADIAAHYPDRQLVLATGLRTNLERRAASIALDKKLAPLCVLLPLDLAAPPEAAFLLPRAEKLLATGCPIPAQGQVHVHIGDDPPSARRLVTITPNGTVRTAPWL